MSESYESGVDPINLSPEDVTKRLEAAGDNWDREFNDLVSSADKAIGSVFPGEDLRPGILMKGAITHLINQKVWGGGIRDALFPHLNTTPESWNISGWMGELGIALADVDLDNQARELLDREFVVEEHQRPVLLAIAHSHARNGRVIHMTRTLQRGALTGPGYTDKDLAKINSCFLALAESEVAPTTK